MCVKWRAQPFSKGGYRIITGPILNKFGKTHPSLKEMSIQIKGHILQQGDNVEIANSKYIDDIWQSFTLEQQNQFQPNLTQFILGLRVFKCVQTEDLASFQGKIIMILNQPASHYNHSFVQDRLLLGNGSQVSDVAHEPLV